MPLYYLDDEIFFPPIYFAEEDGLLAVGGDLSPERLLHAYSEGIFPWFGEEDPILWWSPDPRLVLIPEEIHIARSMRPIFNQRKYRVSLDTEFAAVIRQCAQTNRPGQESTWLTQEMQDAYIQLHELGFAHSVEVWQGDTLVGGLYGIALGRAFFGESMFSHASNASKTGFIHLTLGLQQLGFGLIDCQVYTGHLQSLGAREIPRKEFYAMVQQLRATENIRGKWTDLPAFRDPWTVYRKSLQ